MVLRGAAFQKKTDICDYYLRYEILWYAEINLMSVNLVRFQVSISKVVSNSLLFWNHILYVILN